jgi:hypothetical protein
MKNHFIRKELRRAPQKLFLLGTLTVANSRRIETVQDVHDRLLDRYNTVLISTPDNTI